MFTPQRKGWPGWSPSPARASGGDVSAQPSRRTSLFPSGKGKDVVGMDPQPPPPPPQGSLGDGGGDLGDGGEDLGDGGEDLGAWRRFREAGLLDESALQRKDLGALLQRISELERELHEYQYNMGLLLIEKKEWSSQYDEVRGRLAETDEILKREHASHLIALSEVEKREENMRNALGVEKQCVADLEKALHEMRGQIAEVKFTSDKKLADAHALEASLEEKALDIERKLHSADAMLAEANRKSSEIETKLEDIEARERRVQRDFLSLDNEKKAYEKDLAKQREHLRDWEKSLQDRQKRLVDEHGSLNGRELRANEANKVLKKKEEELEEARKRSEFISNSLKEKDDDINIRLRALAAKEKEANMKQEKLELKERDLVAMEERLNAREKVEIQKLIDEHNSLSDAKCREFELEMGSKRRSFDEEVRAKLEEVNKREHEINDKESEVFKREQALESVMDSLRDKERDLDSKLETLKDMKSSLTNEEEKLCEEKKVLQKETQLLAAYKTQLEKLKASIEGEKEQAIREKENLKLTQEERDQHLQLQLKLKEEIESCRLMEESLAKQIEDLRLEREQFEKEWEAVDEKRSGLIVEIKRVTDEREKFENWRHNEEERLKKERLDARVDMERELAELNLKMESFEKLKAHELSEARGELERGQADISVELEQLKYDLNIKMQKKEKEMEDRLKEKENEFTRKRDAELTNIRASSNLNESLSCKLKAEQERVERDKEELSMHRKRLEIDQHEIQKDIDALRVLSQNLKDQHEVFVKERDQFLAVAEECRVCKNCGSAMCDLELLCLRPMREIEEVRNSFPPSSAGTSGTGMSWLQKCSKVFKFSPLKNKESCPEAKVGQFKSFGGQLGREGSDIAGKNGTPSLFGVADNSADFHKVLDNGEGGPSVPFNYERNEREASSLPADSESHPEASKQSGRQPRKRGRPKLMKRTHSVKAVVEDAKAILGETSVDDRAGQLNGDADNSLNTQEESQGDSVHRNHMPTNSRQRKRPADTSRTTSEMDAEESEVRSVSMSLGGCRKRQHTTAAGNLVPGEKRYNFRRSTIAGTDAAALVMSEQSKAGRICDQQLAGNKMLTGAEDMEETSKPAPSAAPSYAFTGESKKPTDTLLKTNVPGTSVQALMSSHKITLLEKEKGQTETNDYMVAKSVEYGGQSMDKVDELNGIQAPSPTTPSDGESGSDNDGSDDGDDESDRHNASIGKKLWNFLTT